MTSGIDPVCGMTVKPESSHRFALITASAARNALPSFRQSGAQRSRAPIQRLADVVSGYFVPAGVLYPVFGLLLSPIIAAAAMSFSSMSVIANAIRLNRIRL